MTTQVERYAPGDRVIYRGTAGTVRSVAHWMNPASIDARLDDGRLVYDLEIHFTKPRVAVPHPRLSEAQERARGELAQRLAEGETMPMSLFL